MSDSEVLIRDEGSTNTKSPPDDLSSLVSDLCHNIPVKMSILLFLVIMIVNSDVFIENILIFIPGSSVAGQPTSFGTILQALIIVLTFILISVFTAPKKNTTEE